MMCLTRIYCKRKRDGVLFRFNSMRVMREYSRANNECKKSLPVIDRAEFMRLRDRRYENPTWIKSKQFNGMAMMRDGAA